jgi:hypothetical protein
MKTTLLSTALLASFAATYGQIAQADDDGTFSLETGMHYNTGKYGGTQSTDILYIPVTGKYKTGLWTLRLTVPYLQITGPTNVIAGIGTTGGTAGVSSTRSGLGDVIAAATRNVYYDPASGFAVNMTGKIKFGTADSAKALGTGENDYSFQVEPFKIKDNLTTFGTFGYKIYGSTPTYTLNNVFFGSVGGSYKLDQDMHGGMMVSYSQATTTNGSAQVEAILFADHKIEQSWKVQAYALKGFTRSVPSYGAGITIGYQF